MYVLFCLLCFVVCKFVFFKLFFRFFRTFLCYINEYDTNIEIDETKKATDKVIDNKDDWKVLYPSAFERIWRVNRNEMTFEATKEVIIVFVHGK